MCSLSPQRPVCRFHCSRVHSIALLKSQPVPSVAGSSAALHRSALTVWHMACAVWKVVAFTHWSANQPPLVAPHTPGTPFLPVSPQHWPPRTGSHSPSQRCRLGQQPISGGMPACISVVGALVGEAVGAVVGAIGLGTIGSVSTMKESNWPSAEFGSPPAASCRADWMIACVAGVVPGGARTVYVSWVVSMPSLRNVEQLTSTNAMGVGEP
mmetsp:Transcript_7842/g.48609  ORF Transcript_7842/g.48609 Transcript_7842/m.48609 type:complete len:211 (-) Transcript_7842:294-926(-)